MLFEILFWAVWLLIGLMLARAVFSGYGISAFAAGNESVSLSDRRPRDRKVQLKKRHFRCYMNLRAPSGNICAAIRSAAATTAPSAFWAVGRKPSSPPAIRSCASIRSGGRSPFTASRKNSSAEDGIRAPSRFPMRPLTSGFPSNGQTGKGSGAPFSPSPVLFDLAEPLSRRFGGARRLLILSCRSFFRGGLSYRIGSSARKHFDGDLLRYRFLAARRRGGADAFRACSKDRLPLQRYLSVGAAFCP